MNPSAKHLERIVQVGKGILNGFAITAPVGDWKQGAVNIPSDVCTIQLMLEHAARRAANPRLDPKGIDGSISRQAGKSSTVNAITAFQRTFMSQPDGLIEPSGETLGRLHEYCHGLSKKSQEANHSILKAKQPADGLPSWMRSFATGAYDAAIHLLPQPANKMPEWIAAAEQEYGVGEAEETDKKKISEYHSTTKNLPKAGKKQLAEETPWCSSFVNWVMIQAGIEGTNSRSSHSWRNWGDTLDKPAVGSVAFIDWGPIYPDKPDKQGKGHVGFVVGKTDKGRIVLLGGNQGDKVKYAAFKASVIVNYHVPKGYQVDSALFDLPIMNIKSGGTSYAATR